MDDLAKLPTICDSFSNLAVVSKVADVSTSSGNDFVCSVGGGNNVDSIVVDGNNVYSNGEDGNCIDSSRFETTISDSRLYFPRGFSRLLKMSGISDSIIRREWWGLVCPRLGLLN
ncbi:hypothetical protein NE237_000724 [Protea cynaroides]|uniref:Uncharacterized protein n=1 Tax=Protea cynaroides TaxID=273540 RepID=A0A9Q0KRQ6_9MAGN|nr:hypothetical protein NE237_000724 [Protea cynaroides]